MEQFRITVRFDTDDDEHANELTSLLMKVAPYMVDNVSVVLEYNYED